MDKQQTVGKVRALFVYWRAQDRSFRIAIWIGIFLIAAIIYLHHYLEPLATDTEFVAESDAQEEHIIDTSGENDFINASLDDHHPEAIESLQQHEFSVKVKTGDTLSDIFTRYEINAKDLYAILALKTAKPILTHLKLDQEIFITMDRGHNLQKLSTQIAFNKTLYITRPEPEFKVKIEEQEAVTKLTTARGTINTSLYRSTRDAKIPQKIALQLANVFSGKLNFARDLHPGDSYQIIYQRKMINDTTVGVGNIMAAEVVANKKTYTAIRYEKSNGQARYYSPEGQSLQRAFIRNPVKYARISSKFNPQRMHPILNIKRPHYGVDYAAPAGTPIKAAGDGKVIFAGKKGGYGNTIIINHGNNVTTRYGHMKRFAKNIHTGSRVEKGNIIGYVGSTGLATGPHLHYEYRRNGKALNPLTVSLPESYSVPKSQLKAFQQISSPLLAKLHTNTQFAKANMMTNKDTA